MHYVGTPERNEVLGKSWLRREDNIEMNLKEIIQVEYRLLRYRLGRLSLSSDKTRASGDTHSPSLWMVRGSLMTSHESAAWGLDQPFKDTGNVHNIIRVHKEA
jgi:hypothetical protein